MLEIVRYFVDNFEKIKKCSEILKTFYEYEKFYGCVRKFSKYFQYFLEHFEEIFRIIGKLLGENTWRNSNNFWRK